MILLKTATFVILASAFLLRIPRAIRHRQARLTWAATGIGALALLTLGTLIPQAVLDAPLGGHNLLKLIQTSLALVAIWLGAQSAITLGPAHHRMNGAGLVVMVILPAVPFFFIRRAGPTNLHFLDENIRQFPAWFYATCYLVALMYICLRLIAAFHHHKEPGALLIKQGSAAVIIAGIVEVANFTLQLIGGSSDGTAAVLSHIFNLVFYLGICVMTLGIVAYASARTLRQWRIPRLLTQLTRATTQAGERPAELGALDGPPLARLYSATVTLRDLLVAGTIQPTRRQRRALYRAERIIAHSLIDPPREGPPTITTYPGSRL